MLSLKTFLFFVVVLALQTIFSSTTTSFVNALADGDVTFEMQPIPTHYRRIRVTFSGANFTNSTRFRLTNVTNCASGVANGLSADTFTNTEKWTFYDSVSYYVASFNAEGEGDQAYACVSEDDGVTYYMAANSEGRYNFRVWGKVPTAKITPATPIINAITRVTVGNLPSGSRIAITQSATGCRGATPLSVVPGGASTTAISLDSQFSYADFTFTSAVTRAYVCVATAPSLTDWTLAPVDEDDEMIFRSNHYNNIAAPSDMITGRITSSYFTIFTDTNAARSNYIECDTPLVQGKTSRCYMWIQDPALITVNPADFEFTFLTDGAGVEECPFPTIAQAGGNTTHVYFDWTPQRWGRDGKFSINYQNLPINMGFTDIAASSLGLTLPNSTHYSFRHDINDTMVTRFIVLPPDTKSVDYAAESNLLTNIQSFSGLGNFAVTHGNPDDFSNSVAMGGEAYYATLSSSVTQATMTRTISGIASASRCKFNVRYSFFPSSGNPDHTRTSLVGRASVVSRDNTPADITTLKTFYIYVQGQSMIVTGADVIPLGVTGDIRTQESLSFELQWNINQDGFRIELETYHTEQERFYWFEPEFKCLPASAGGPTLPADVTALENLYNSFTGAGQAELRRTWRNDADTAFNGDPCLNGWTGVICRNQRVTELKLAGLQLEGSLTTDLGDLTFLEVLRLGRNEMTGSLPANLNNLVRLRTFDISNNQFLGSIPATFASTTTNLCLKRMMMQKNRFDAYPTQTITHPVLETLRLEFNAMTGTVPNFTVTTVPLRELSVAHNRLSGYLPQNLPFDSLIILDLSDNTFDGPIPTSWSQFKNIHYIDISHNQISGGVPYDLALIRSGNYLTFRAQDNYLGGFIPRLPFEGYDLRQNVIACPEPTFERFSNLYQIKGLLYDECDYSGWVQFEYSPYVVNDTSHLAPP